MIDYLQLLRGTDSLQARRNLTVEVLEIRGLKAVGKDLNILVLALLRLSHDVKSTRMNTRS